MATKKADFRTFYKDAHAVECLSEREKMLMVRPVEPPKEQMADAVEPE